MGEGGGHWEFKYATNLFVFTSPCDPPAHIVNFLDENGEPIWTQGNLLPDVRTHGAFLNPEPAMQCPSLGL